MANLAYMRAKTGKTIKPSFGGALLNFGGLDFVALTPSPHANMSELGIGSEPLDTAKTVSIGNINGDFIGNTAGGNLAYGGGIANVSMPGAVGPLLQVYIGRTEENTVKEIADNNPLDISIGDIKGNFINNKASSGGAIANFKMHDEAAAPLANVIVSMFGGGFEGVSIGSAATMLNRKSTLQIGDISGNFIGNKAVVSDFKDFQGAIDSIYTLTNMQKEYLEKELIQSGEASSLDEFFEMARQTIDAGKPDGVPENEWQEQLAMCNLILGIEKGLDTASLDADLKDSLAKGGAILNYDGNIKSITNSSFINNSALSDAADIKAAGGAIYTNTDLKIIAKDGYVSTFSGNTVENNRVKRPEAIYVQEAELTLETKNNGKFQFNDEINGQNFKLNITGDNTGVVALNNNVQNAEIKINETTVNVAQGQHLNNNNSLNVSSGTLNINHLGVAPIHFNDIALTDGEVNFNSIDVDLANNQMGRISANSYSNVSENAKINVNGFNLVSDSKNPQTEILFADKNIMNNVNCSVTDAPDGTQDLTAFTPIYQYKVNYNKTDDGGFFVFNRGGSSTGGAATTFNPAILAGPIAAQSGALSVTTQTFNYAFQNADNFMNIPYLERLAIKTSNQYALTENNAILNNGNYSPLYRQNKDSSIWVKPYASFENVPLKNGPKVSNITYGTLVGYDTEFVPMKNGWDRVWTGYIGYNGASQHYNGVNSTQNGGLLGGTLTLYKGNFFNATTVSAGANVGSNQTMYGHENITMLLAGIGNKTGYNFEFKEGKIIFQPSLMMSYTFVNSFDYTNAAGVKIDNEPLHALQLAPGMKIIGNTKNGWQPYIGVNMVWNLMDKSHTTANGVVLPEMSIKPYIQYGVGVQKRFKDRCLAFGQAMIQNGGRNGVSLTAGFRYSLGTETKKEQVQEAPRKIVKQLSPQQKIALTQNQRTTTRTTANAILKQL